MGKSAAMMGLLVLCVVGASAQRLDIDSIEEQLETKRSDTSKVGLLQRSSMLVSQQRPALALDWATQSLNLSQAIGYAGGEANSYLVMARVMTEQGRLEKALDVAETGLEAFAELEDQAGVARARIELAAVLRAQGKPDMALAQLDTARQLSGDDIGLQVAINQGVAMSHQQAGEIDRALFHLNEALAMVEKSGSKRQQAVLHQSLAVLFGLQADYPKAEQQYRHALTFYQQKRELTVQGDIHTKLSGLSLVQGNSAAASEHLAVALDLYKEANDKPAIARTHLEMAQLAVERSDFKEAKESAELGMRMANDIGSKDSQLKAASMLTEIYQGLGEMRKAYLYQQLTSEIKGELLNESMVEKMQQMEMAHELEQQVQENELLRKNKQIAELESETRQAEISNLWVGIIGSMVVAVLLLVVIGLVVARLRNRKKANEALEAEISERKKVEDKLRELNNELNTLMYKSSHDLKSPLASAIGLTNVAKLDVKDEMAMKYIGMISDRMSYLDNMLTNLINTSKIRSGVIQAILIDFPQLVSRILESIDQMHGYDTIDIQTEIDVPKPFFSDTGMLTTIIQNLVTNAVKYQDTNKPNAYCKVEVKGTFDGVRIRIEDNGIGIDDKIKEKAFEMFYRATSQSDGSGLGLYIVMSSVKKVKGEINLETEKGVGTTITIDLPTLKKPEDSFTEVSPLQREDSEG